ncbi:MAG TPA: vanadium-dependent haloperoxidase [Chitinophagaceae bacterium]|nr:vanadium-dependent haloperoxidase [Chitinophagaceae bacterium]
MSPSPEGQSSEVAVKWAEITLYVLRYSAFNTPTYSSRSLGYLGLAQYESIVPGDPAFRSLSGQLPGLNLGAPSGALHWPLALNASQETLLKKLYTVPGNSHRFIHDKIDSLYGGLLVKYRKDIDAGVVRRSEQWGRKVAEAVFNWSKTDGGHEGYTRNFDPAFSYPTGPEYWSPPLRGQTISLYPLHPHWGKNRTFAPGNNELPVPAITPYSTDPGSAFYQYYKAVYEKDKSLTQDEMEAAAWWGDDPTESFSPPGHSYHMAILAVSGSNASLMKAAETFAKTGMAVADAFIHCWKAKYTYFNERPSTYIRKHIDPVWIPFWPEPPFPAFPSGHSIQSSAAATVLTQIFGTSFSFTDRVHEHNRRIDDIRFLDLRYPARSYQSFWEAADECARSRFYGGIHTEQDNVVGTEEGKKIGKNVLELRWKQ